MKLVKYFIILLISLTILSCKEKDENNTSLYINKEKKINIKNGRCFSFEFNYSGRNRIKVK